MYLKLLTFSAHQVYTMLTDHRYNDRNVIIKLQNSSQCVFVIDHANGKPVSANVNGVNLRYTGRNHSSYLRGWLIGFVGLCLNCSLCYARIEYIP